MQYGLGTQRAHIVFTQSIAPAGCGAEAAIGQLTRLTSLLLSIDGVGTTASDPAAPLQLQLLGRSVSAGGAGNGSSSDQTRCPAGVAANSNTSLQELTLECTGQLLDDELAAAAAALPDLRRLKISQPRWPDCTGLWGFKGAGLAAFSACPRLRDISLWQCVDVECQQLVTHVPQVGSLARLQHVLKPKYCSELLGTDTADDDARRVCEAFYLKHGRHLQVVRRL